MKNYKKIAVIFLIFLQNIYAESSNITATVKNQEDSKALGKLSSKKKKKKKKTKKIQKI